jgi:hypothetical protein
MPEVCLMLQGRGWSDILAARKKREEQIAAVSFIAALGVLVVVLRGMASEIS